MRNELQRRLGPFLALLDAKYAPLLFAVAPQAYNVFLWLWRNSDHSPEAGYFAVAGAIGYEFIYVGAIAWAEEGKSSFWTWATATLALIFSIGVAVYVNLGEGGWAALHAGFPLVAFCYVINMYKATGKQAEQHHIADTAQMIATEPQAERRSPLEGIDVVAVVRANSGNLTAAARELGVSRQAVSNRLKGQSA